MYTDKIAGPDLIIRYLALVIPSPPSPLDTISDFICPHPTSLHLRLHKGLDDEKQFAMTFLDISKAFDKVWHDGLLFKLDSIGIKGKLLKLIKSYLGFKKQRVVLNGSVSEFLNILSGVPQGSILGPLFFLVFLNDIIDNIECHISLFADDTSLLSIAKSWMTVEAELNLALTKVNIWAQKWLVTFNATKTVYLTFSNSTG